MPSWKALAKIQRTPAGLSIFLPNPPPEPPVGDGINELTNSKWAGSGMLPDNWSFESPEQGAVTAAAGDLSEHRKLRFVSTETDYGDKALLVWPLQVTAGERITISVTARSVDSSSDDHVIINHAPFANGTIVGGSGTVGADARPRINDLIADEVAWYTVEATATGVLSFYFGLDRTGDVTLEAPMIDRFSGLRNYVATDPVEEPEPEPGVNEVPNSKWAGSGLPPDNWTYRTPSTATVTAATGARSGHRQLRFVSEAADYSDTALLQQTINVTAGEVITVSADVRAINSTSPDHVVLNHFPYAHAKPIAGSGLNGDFRPKIDDLVVGQRCWYTFQVDVTGTLNVYWGLDRTGDVTLEAPMLDRNDSVREYVATNPVVDPDPPPPNPDPNPDSGDLIDVASLPWRGQYLGLPLAVLAMNVFQTKFNPSTSNGWIFRARATGHLRKMQVDLASNFSDQGPENTKSTYNGANPHGYPASWPHRFRLWRLNSEKQIVGDYIWQLDWTYTNPDGRSRNSRVRWTVDPNVSVENGEFLWLQVINMTSGSSQDNYISFNSFFNNQAPPLGSSPPRLVDRFHQDYPYPTQGSTTGGINSTRMGIMTEIVLPGGLTVIDGAGHIDCTPSYLSPIVGGNFRLRQQFNYPVQCQASQALIAARARGTGGSLTMRISGSGIPTVTVNISPGTFGSYHETKIIELGQTITLRPGVNHTVELFSTGSNTSNGYEVYTIRRYRTDGALTSPGLANSSLISPWQAVDQTPLTRNGYGSTNGGLQQSTNGGNSWSGFNDSNLPWGLVLKNVQVS